MFDLSVVQWVMAVLAALSVGISKAGFSGVGIIQVYLMTELFGIHQVGVLLPMLIVADLIVFPAYRKHGSWPPVWTLLWPALVGMLAGFYLLGKMPEGLAKPLIGGIILLMAALQLVRKNRPEAFQPFAESRSYGAGAGVVAGFATAVANAAGPVFQLFLLSRNIPKFELIGIGARFFLLINLIKLPFTGGLGLTTGESLLFNLKLVPVIFLGVVVGKWLLERVSQKWFERLVLIFALLAGGKLLLFS
ncbi:sulfite exporter TauE/SafE family protein [Roseibacillus ishigakijimensis]|uniref:Probable membrane transporter protein n=1 Tax=Roseibacillus ishigakijimensis TaxID=454146 RepID=A0A934RLK7_9BACT|nr:sulfite exporter TauE/SafE family protein [Roseibacillus ishigakijimensis]MBK1833078.1 sulfite exporter TauE/SafE family protein [Roseibacillus ishigakijimensis]